MEGHDLKDEHALAERAKTDDAAFTKLYEFYLPRVYGYVCRRVGDRATAEDLTSQAFLNAVAALPKYRPTAPFGAWLFRIATNVLIDHYRVLGRRPNEALEAAEGLADRRPDAAAEADRKAERERLERVLALLPERERRLLTLKYFSELSNVEIAEAEGLKPNHVGVLLHRALKNAHERYLQL
jgi:RNA polymerase sigma-70 factor (ECF subfamily)